MSDARRELLSRNYRANKRPSDIFHVDKISTNAQEQRNAALVSPTQCPPDSTSFVKILTEDTKQAVFYPVIPSDSIRDLKEIKLSGPVRSQFGFTFGPTPRINILQHKMSDTQPVVSALLNIEKTIPGNRAHRLQTSELHQLIQEHFADYPLCPGQALILPCADENGRFNVIFSVTAVNGQYALPSNAKPSDALFNLNNQSKLQFTVNAELSRLKLSNETSEPNQTQRGLLLDFAGNGVGGHKKEIERIIRQGFYSRAMPPQFAKAYGVKHTKGILLYGPPGTGKTLIARVISNIFTRDKVKIVNAAELKNPYVGQSAQNVRNVFNDAAAEWAQRGEASDLHVIIFDEIDALAPARGSRPGGSGVNEDIVGQLLTLLDGVDSPQNVLIIGMTNRKDLIDPALLRPGRIEVHIEIGLPNLPDRKEILEIKTKQMREQDLLSPDVDTTFWARKTINYTGAELEQLVKSAANYAMGKNFSTTEKDGFLKLKSDIDKKDKLSKVSNEHFERAFADITPAFGIDRSIMTRQIENFTPYDANENHIVKKFDSLTDSNNKSHLRAFNYLLSGEEGTGKSHLALALAYKTGAKHIKRVSPENLLSLPLDRQLTYLDNIFTDAKRAENSVIILDDLEAILGANAELHHYNNVLRLKLIALMKSLDSPDNNVIVIGATHNTTFLKRMGLFALFNEHSQLHNINLTPENSAKTIACLSQSLGFQGKLRGALVKKDFDISISVHNLTYELRKFLATNNNSEQMDLNEFVKSLEVNYSNEDDIERTLREVSQLNTESQRRLVS